MHVRGSIGLVLVLALVGCKSAEQKIMDEHHDAIVAQLDKLKALAAVARKEPHLGEASWPVQGAAFGRGGNAQVVFAEKLGAPCNARVPKFTEDPAKLDLIILTQTDHSDSWLDKPVCGLEGNSDLMLGMDQDDVQMLLGMKYALLLRFTVKQAPELDGAEAHAAVAAYLDGGKKDVEHFDGGRLAGDALLYEVASGKRVGNFPFDVHSSETVQVRGADFSALELDLNAKLDDVVRERIAPK